MPIQMTVRDHLKPPRINYVGHAIVSEAVLKTAIPTETPGPVVAVASVTEFFSLGPSLGLTEALRGGCFLGFCATAELFLQPSAVCNFEPPIWKGLSET